MEVLELLSFWGKTIDRPNNPSINGQKNIEGEPPYKPVLHHLMDVAAVALQWYRLNPSRLKREAALLQVSPEQLSTVSAFLAGLHDLGKFSSGFQTKVPELWPTRILGARRQEADRGHWRNTAILFRSESLAQDFNALFPNLPPDDVGLIIAAVAGHHGHPPEPSDVDSPASKAGRDAQIGEACVTAAFDAFRLIRDMIRPEPLDALNKHVQTARWSWRLNGLVTLADWVGSDNHFFSFEPIDTPLKDYWEWALCQARKAIEGKGLRPQKPVHHPRLEELAPQAAIRPRPMQKLAEKAPLVDAPQLFIMEDTTGAGKTEAAIMLAARLMATGRGEGLYFALPTMATANAMWERLEATYRSLFLSSTLSPSLVLAHGKSSLSSVFSAIVNSADAMNGDESEDTTSTFCAEWIADNRRKAFFADVGAGTIDQAFLGVLRKKHLTLRQYGLAGRILIVDEAHCFDAYMGEELAALLELHAQNGGSAIVLSATLSLEQRRTMAEAFAKGLGLRDPEDVGSEAYPLLTSVAYNGVKEYEPGFDPVLRRKVFVERVPDRTKALAEALAASRKGSAVLVICNAVDEAIDMFASLSAEMDGSGRLHLFHARFTQGDRQCIEDDILRRFGRNAAGMDRDGHVLVATQVVEQSLDLDFDLIISDLAPVDLLIQRAGRMWRHLEERPPEGRPDKIPRLLVVSPDPGLVEDEEWLEPTLGRAAFVYRHAGIMWRSARVLFDAGCLDTPESFRPLIESVYGSWDVPPVLEQKQCEGEGARYGEGTLARFNVIEPEKGYSGLPTPLSSSENIGTRLGEETVTLRLARLEAEKIVPWCLDPDGDIRKAWALSEIQVRKKWLHGVSPPSGEEARRKEAKRDWARWECEEIEIAVIDEIGKARLEAKDGAHTFTYCRQAGFRRTSPQAHA